MQYFEYLIFFIIIPSVLLFLVLIKAVKNSNNENGIYLKHIIIPIGFISLISLLYTTPWDNFLVANKIWWYDPNLISGYLIGYVPLEEYTFFVLETFFVGLISFLMIQFKFIKFPETIKLGFSFRKFITLSIISIIWLSSLIILVAGSPNYKYLTLIIVWALIPIGVLLIIGWDLIIKNIKNLSISIFLIGGYLSLTDLYAISLGIWTINPKNILNFNFLSLPFEEALFFYVTTLLVVFGTIITYYYINIKNFTSNFRNQVKLHNLIQL